MAQVNEGTENLRPVNDEGANADLLMARLQQLYERQQRLGEFQDERAIYLKLIAQLVGELEPYYRLETPVGLGSTATVWIVLDKQLQQRRALKLPRPRLGLLRNIIEIVRDERVKLAALNHQNVIKIFSAGEVRFSYDGEEYSFPYFVMEFLDEVQDLDKFILDNYRRLSARAIIGFFRDVASGLAFLHSESIVHCDVKPGNILIAPGRPALIADLGYAKHLQRIQHDDRETSVKFTPRYAHPELREKIIEASDPAANVSLLQRNDLREAFDLYAFGRTMQDVLISLREAERSDAKMHYGQKSTFTRYEWLSLTFFAKRLLDGIVENQSNDELVSDMVPGLTENVMQEIKYNSSGQAIEDLDKLLHLYDLEGEVPELNPNLPTYIQIPHCRVPLTRRVQQVISHPLFGRLGNVTQLGFISLVYPGANHSRLEHVLGTFSRCCDYMRSLWYDQANCIFQMVMSARDISLGLATALIHDIAQYPMAHDLTEVDNRFAHERLTRQILERQGPVYRESLANILESEWDVSADDVIDVLNAGEGSAFRHRILRSIISGPIDCDKLDYIKRDSTHIGVTFGASIDEERLMRNLTVVYSSTSEQVTDPDGRPRTIHRLDVAEIGVTEKALVIAKAIHRARRDMFRQVYWQHTVRALKAMLGFVVRRIMLKLADDAKRVEFWSAFQEFIIEGASPSQIGEEREALEDRITVSDPLGINDDEAKGGSFTLMSYLSISDDRVLQFLWRFAGQSEKAIITDMRSRNLFRRLAVLSGNRRNADYENIYNNFRAHRVEADLRHIEEQRLEWQREIAAIAKEKIIASPAILGGGSLEDTVRELELEDPLILVDIPVKALSKQANSELLGYLPEDLGGVHDRQRGALPQFSKSELYFDEANFDKQVGKVRVFAHPEWCSLLARCFRDEDVIKIISS